MGKGNTRYTKKCSQCGATGPVGDSREQATKLYETRTSVGKCIFCGWDDGRIRIDTMPIYCQGKLVEQSKGQTCPECGASNYKRLI